MNKGLHIVRVITTIHLLQNQCYTMKELSKKFNVNRKTINRDFVEIKNCGFKMQKYAGCLYRIVGDLPEIEELKKQDTGIKQVNRYTFYGQYSNKTAIIKKAKDGDYFYIIKDANNKTEYVSSKYKQPYICKRHLKLAL